MGVEATLMGGYGFKSSTYKELESSYGVAPDAWLLGSVMADFQWSPIYAKMNVAGKRIYHHDVFFTAGLGGTLERAIQPDASTTVSPTLGASIGFRVFTGKDLAVRVQLRDDLLIQKRVKTADTQAPSSSKTSRCSSASASWVVSDDVQAMAVGRRSVQRSGHGTVADDGAANRGLCRGERSHDLWQPDGSGRRPHCGD